MAITIKEPTVLAAIAAIGEVMPVGTSRVYTAAGAHNPTGAPVTLTVHLVPANGAPADSNRILNRNVAAGKTDLCLELIGRGLPAGSQLYAGGAGINFGYTAVDTVTN